MQRFFLIPGIYLFVDKIHTPTVQTYFLLHAKKEQRGCNITFFYQRIHVTVDILQRIHVTVDILHCIHVTVDIL